MAWCGPIDPWQVKAAKRIRKECEAWQRAYRILFPEKPKLAPVLVVDNVIPLPDRITAYMQTQERRDGKRPTHQEAADHFGVHRTTVGRALAKAS